MNVLLYMSRGSGPERRRLLNKIESAARDNTIEIITDFKKFLESSRIICMHQRCAFRHFVRKRITRGCSHYTHPSGQATRYDFKRTFAATSIYDICGKRFRRCQGGVE
jgi:hypothetical protein